MVKERNDRIEELSEALKESVSITADRETVLAQQTQTVTNLQKQVIKSNSHKLVKIYYAARRKGGLVVEMYSRNRCNQAAKKWNKQ